VLFFAIPTTLWDTVVTVCIRGSPEREHFRTINVQWIGNGAFLALCGSS
jgi:hypothetical protein